MIYKNTYGVTAAMKGQLSKHKQDNPFTGSSRNRKKADKRKLVTKSEQKTGCVILDFMPEGTIEEKSKEKIMSQRTKSKIRRKIIAFSQLFKRLSFLTLTFVNKVEDELAVVIVRKFLDNIKKNCKDFQYLWVAEKQTKNEIFKDNIHFHIVTNKYWVIDKHWKYWLDVQKKNGIIPRDENFKPSSAFDVRSIISNNIKGITSYLTKYVTKNASKLKCQIWNCSKKISGLYTDFYSDNSFLENIKKLEGIEIKEIPLEHCNLFLIPLSQKTMSYYNVLRTKNTSIWNKRKDSQLKPIE